MESRPSLVVKRSLPEYTEARTVPLANRASVYAPRQFMSGNIAITHEWVDTMLSRDSEPVKRKVTSDVFLHRHTSVSDPERHRTWNFSAIRSSMAKLKLALPVKLFKKPEPRQKKKLALLLPGHNEEFIIATTIRSAMAAGQDKSDIYVVDDCSNDKTRQEAIAILGEGHVLTVERSGKALAVKKAIEHFNLIDEYQWMHIADADSVFGADYFRIYKKKLDPKKYAVAVGFVQSLRGNWISTYRATTYTYSQHVNRRVQSKLGMISVFPGPITCFRTDILDKLDFEANSLTEDFDITLQVHRKKLGKILFIPKAVNYTQDPQTLRDFCKQNLRWQRGFFQGVRKHKIGLRPQAIDISIGYQLWQTVFYLLQMFVLVPYLIATTGRWQILLYILAADFVLTGVITIMSSAVIKRWNLLGALPYFYFMRWLEVGIFITAFVEIYILQKFHSEIRGWDVKGRRYKLDANALKDAAAA
jgi:cellulose synthase/poly-beta-1,6-N-acetylglucosamine synthase-like glycosyltransferase